MDEVAFDSISGIKLPKNSHLDEYCVFSSAQMILLECHESPAQGEPSILRPFTKIETSYLLRQLRRYSCYKFLSIIGSAFANHVCKESGIIGKMMCILRQASYMGKYTIVLIWFRIVLTQIITPTSKGSLTLTYSLNLLYI